MRVKQGIARIDRSCVYHHINTTGFGGTIQSDFAGSLIKAA